MQTTLTYTIE